MKNLESKGKKQNKTTIRKLRSLLPVPIHPCQWRLACTQKDHGHDTPLKCCYMVVCFFFFSRRSFSDCHLHSQLYTIIGLDSIELLTQNQYHTHTLIRTKQKQHMLLWNNCLLTPLNLFTFNTKYSKRIFLSTPPNPLIDKYRAS